MPRSRMDELFAIAEDNDGLLTSKQARGAGIIDSVLVRLAQRGRLKRAARGVYRIAQYPQVRLSQYREAILWAKASRGPKDAALSHETALAVYGISDANPSHVHITVPKSARLRKKRPTWITIHRDNLRSSDAYEYEGLPVTTVSRTIADLLSTFARIDLVRQAIRDAKRAGLISSTEAARLKRRVNQSGHQFDEDGSLPDSKRDLERMV